MNQLTIKLKKTIDQSYPIIIGEGLFSNLPKHLRNLGNFGSFVIITDDFVGKLYGRRILRMLKKEKGRSFLLTFPAGEKSKTQRTKSALEEQMIKKGCGRDTLIIALGGGVVGDLAGFIAATYMRGIPYIQIPTTLLAMVDSSLGGKTGIDTPLGKNLIGAFWQPKKVLIDLDFLKQLPDKQIINGYYEVVKMAITSSKDLFVYAEQNLEAVKKADIKVLQRLIIGGIKIKAQAVESDEKESNGRMVLNFGHTIGHALEKLSAFKLTHGQAVALGLIIEAKVSVLEGLLTTEEFTRIQALLLKSGVDQSLIRKWKPNQIISAAKTDKKNINGKLKIVLVEGIGKLHRRNGFAASAISDKIVKKSLNSI